MPDNTTCGLCRDTSLSIPVKAERCSYPNCTQRRMFSAMHYTSICKAALEMSYDNGGINRERTEEDALKALGTVLTDYEPKDLALLNVWIGTLNEEELQTLVAGEHEDMMALQKKSPDHVFCGRLMNDIFERAA